jgi:hypothetical protein
MNLLSSAINFWQVKLIFGQILSNAWSCNLISSEMMLSLEQQIITTLEKWEPSLVHPLHAFLSDAELPFDKETVNKLAMYVIFYDIPFKENCLESDLLENMLKFQNKYSVRTLEKIIKIQSYVT